ncbi:MAG: 6-bladed beta-propeller [Tannerella sp.]|nr:6-bladed beta-propeller [Tannerella sp.]
MDIKVISFCCFVVLFLHSCKQNTASIVCIEPCLTVEELNDSTFFKDVYGIIHDTKHIYASDTYNGRVLKFDLDMNYQGSIGTRGQGPGEFPALGGIVCLNDTLYALNCNNGDLSVLTTGGKFVETVRKEEIITFPDRYCMDESKCIYVCSPIDPFPLVKYDAGMNRRFGFGTRRESGDNMLSAERLLYLFGNNILSIKADEPLLALYDRQGKILLDRRIDNHLFSSRLLFKKQEQEKNPANGKKGYKLFYDIAVSGDIVYLLHIYHDSDNRPYCNRIARLVFENGNFRFIDAYQLPDAWYTSICLVGNRLVCYCSVKQEFQIYEL